MKFLGILWTAVAVLVPCFAAAASPEKTPPASGSIIIVLDASGSMRERIKGEPKIEIAKRAVRELVQSLPDDLQIGLVVYGHRKTNECTDIQLLLPPNRIDKTAFIAAVDTIKPNGMTPLSAAVEFAARTLDYTHKPATVILVSDGGETCGKDPCATAAKLKAESVNLVVHTVGFDLSAGVAKSINCIARATGGRFLQAKDAASLKDALSVAVAEAVAVKEIPPPAVVIPVTLKAPAAVIAGTVFSIEWTGPNLAGDTITLIAKAAPDSDDGNLAYTKQGTPLQMTAPLDPGAAEIRYISSRTHAVLGRLGIKINAAAEATLTAPDEAAAGSPVSIGWKGPNNEGDFITIVAKSAADADYERTASTRDGSPALVTAPMESSPAEIRYVSGQNNRVLARRSLKLLPPHVVLKAPDEAVAGSVVTIVWEGPNNANDYLTVVPKTAADGARGAIAYTLGGSPLQVTAPGEATACEIRYMAGWGDKVLARRDLRTVTAQVTLSSADQVVAGSLATVAWTGPNNENDFVTIVSGGAPEDSREGFAWTLQGSPLQVTAPPKIGAAEIRYVRGLDAKVLARRPVNVIAAVISLVPPARAPVGDPVSIVWTGPNNQNDFITIVPKGTPDGTSGQFAWTAAGSPANVNPPEDPGPCEVRYVNGQDERVLSRVAIEIGPAGSSLVLAPVSSVSKQTKSAEPERIAHGQPVKLEEYLVPGKIVLFAFSSPFNGPNQRMDPRLRKLHSSREDLVVVMVDVDRPGAKDVDWASPVGRQFDLKTTGLPLFKVYGPDGSVRAEGRDAESLVWDWLNAM